MAKKPKKEDQGQEQGTEGVEEKTSTQEAQARDPALAEQSSFISEMSDETDEPDEDSFAAQTQDGAEGEEGQDSDASTSSSSSDAQKAGDDTGSTGDDESESGEDGEDGKAAASESGKSKAEEDEAAAKGKSEEDKGEGAAQDPSQTPAPQTQEEVNQLYADWRKESESLLAEHHYKLTQEEIDEIEADPAKALPRHMARVYMDAVTAAISQITTHMPRLVRIVNEQDSASSQAENAFFEAWPDLKEHQDTVIKLGQAYRQINPNASQDEFINEVGAAAMVSLRLDPTNRKNGASNSTPGGNGQGNGRTPATAREAFKPATTSPGALPKRRVEENPFTRLDAEFDEEDIDDFG